MRASLTIGGIEVALSAPAGALEEAVAERYAPFLGAPEAPVCSLVLEPRNGVEDYTRPGAPLIERLGETRFQVTDPGLSGCFDLAGPGSALVAASPYALDRCLRVLFGLLAPANDALMLRATGVISNNVAHVFIGPGGTPTLVYPAGGLPVLTNGLVLVRRERKGWLAASTPFWAAYEKPGPPREGALERLWCLVGPDAGLAVVKDLGAASGTIAEYTYLPTSDPGLGRLARDLALQVAQDVPLSDLRFSGPAGVWDQIDVPVS